MAFKKTCEELSGTDFTQFFNDYVFGVKSIGWEKYFLYAGLELKSGKDTTVPVAGLKSIQKGEKIIITEIIAGSSAEKTGMMTGDEIIALNGVRLNYAEMDKRIKALKSGETLKLTVFRNDEIKNCILTLEEKKLVSYSLEKVNNPTDLQKSIYEGWLWIKW